MQLQVHNIKSIPKFSFPPLHASSEAGPGLSSWHDVFLLRFVSMSLLLKKYLSISCYFLFVQSQALQNPCCSPHSNGHIQTHTERVWFKSHNEYRTANGHNLLAWPSSLHTKGELIASSSTCPCPRCAAAPAQPRATVRGHKARLSCPSAGQR